MCACAFRYGSNQDLVTQGVTVLPSAAFTSGRTYETFMFYRCINEAKFLKALSSVRIVKNDGSEKGVQTTLDKEVKTAEDVRKLANWVDAHKDTQIWGVDINALVRRIQFTNEESKNSLCKIGFSKD